MWFRLKQPLVGEGALRDKHKQRLRRRLRFPKPRAGLFLKPIKSNPGLKVDLRVKLLHQCCYCSLLWCLTKKIFWGGGGGGGMDIFWNNTISSVVS